MPSCKRLLAASLANAQSALQEAYARQVLVGKLEDSDLQRRIIEYMSMALDGARAVARDAGRASAWVWPARATTAAQATVEDQSRVYEYTARLAAENAERVRKQKFGDGRGVGSHAPPMGQPSVPASAFAVASRPAAQVHRTDERTQGVGTASEIKESKQPHRKLPSIYIHGPVGTGKTMLLDLFHEQVRTAGLRVLRQHFYEFMLGLHSRIHNIQQDRPLEVVANMLADEVDVVCFDEFQISDIQDATILPRLFEILFLRGVVVVMTSNTAPQLLYSGGLNRHVHLPAFVALLSQHCTVLGLGSRGGRPAVDYRRRAEAAEFAADLAEAGPPERPSSAAVGNYLCGEGAGSLLEERWSQLRGDVSESARELVLPMGRTLRLERTSGKACRVHFQDLCGAERGEADFLTLAGHFDTIVVEGLQRFTSLEDADMLRRFVKLLDVLYDRRVRLVIAAAAPLDGLFEGIRSEIQGGSMEDLAWRTALYSADGRAGMAPGAVGTLYEAVKATERAESRLREMRTQRYWAACTTARGQLNGTSEGQR